MIMDSDSKQVWEIFSKCKHQIKKHTQYEYERKSNAFFLSD